MMLSDMIGVIALGLEYADELQPILELLTERCPIVIKMIENAELKHCGKGAPSRGSCQAYPRLRHYHQGIGGVSAQFAGVAVSASTRERETKMLQQGNPLG
jgi:hypothetical protein